MRGGKKNVRFSEWITIQFGEKHALTVLVEATPEDLETLSTICATFDTISLAPNALNKQKLKEFIAQIKQLLELNYMLPHSECIKTSTRNFFSHLIRHRPHYPSRPNAPEDTHHPGEFDSIDAALMMINLELNKIGAINTGSMHSPQKPSDPCYFEFDGLPHTLLAFIESIDVALPGTLRQWSHSFKTGTTQILDDYLAQVTSSIQQLTNDNEVDRIISRLEKFTQKVRKNGCDLQADMFLDVAIHGNRSSLRNPHENYEKRLKRQVDTLLNSASPSFNDNFSTFRHMLTKISQTPYIHLNIILNTLCAYMADKKISYPSRQIKTLHNYIHQCIERTVHPLPEYLQTRLENLILLYRSDQNYDDAQNHPRLWRKINKHDFLVSWEANIKIHPEKSYAECYRLTEEDADYNVQDLIVKRSCLTLFKPHRFKSFVTDLLRAEPDYEHSHPCLHNAFNISKQDDAVYLPC